MYYCARDGVLCVFKYCLLCAGLLDQRRGYLHLKPVPARLRRFK
jgi:hypothetical protein